jgi:hypothetical protein
MIPYPPVLRVPSSQQLIHWECAERLQVPPQGPAHGLSGGRRIEVRAAARFRDNPIHNLEGG